MTIYRKGSPEPGPEITETWDDENDRWERYLSGWIQRDTGMPLTEWQRTHSGRKWSAVLGAYGPMDDRLIEPERSVAITPEHRAAGLRYAVATLDTTMSDMNIYKVADAYALYIATGEHPT